MISLRYDLHRWRDYKVCRLFYPYQVFGLIKLLEVELHQYENWTWTFLLCMLFTASEALAQASLDNSENMGNISIAGEN